MNTKRSASSARAAPRARNARPTPDRKIDFSDIAESTDEELGRARSAGSARVGRPKLPYAKQLIAIRLDPRLIARLKRAAAARGLPYQTLVHDLLEKAVAR